MNKFIKTEETIRDLVPRLKEFGEGCRVRKAKPLHYKWRGDDDYGDGYDYTTVYYKNFMGWNTSSFCIRDEEDVEILGHLIRLEDVLEAIDNHYIIDPPKECVFLYWEDRGAIIKMKKKGRYNGLICAYLGRTFLVNFGKYNLKPIEVTDPETRSSDPIFLEILDFYKKNLKQKVSEKWKNGKCFIDQPKETKEFITDILKKNEV